MSKMTKLVAEAKKISGAALSLSQEEQLIDWLFQQASESAADTLVRLGKKHNIDVSKLRKEVAAATVKGLEGGSLGLDIKDAIDKAKEAE